MNFLQNLRPFEVVCMSMAAGGLAALVPIKATTGTVNNWLVASWITLWVVGAGRYLWRTRGD